MATHVHRDPALPGLAPAHVRVRTAEGVDAVEIKVRVSDPEAALALLTEAVEHARRAVLVRDEEVPE